MKWNNAMKKKYYNWTILLIFSALYGITQNNRIMYAIFILFFISFCVKILKEKNKKNSILDLLLISAIIPDNYIVILYSIIAMLLTVRKRQKFNPYFVLIILLLFGNIVCNIVNPINFLFFFIYSFPFWTLYVFFSQTSENKIIYEELIVELYFIVFSQLISIFTYAISHMSIIHSASDLDWVTGTLGPYQGTVLMFICVCCSTILLFDFTKRKNKKSLIISIISLAIALATTSLTYTIILMISFIGCLIICSKLKSHNKVALLSFVFIGSIAFIIFSPDWVVNEIPKLFEQDYFVNRVKKLEAYRNVFISMPKEFGFLCSIIGCGAGQYSSRAALTCTGTYIDSYSTFFPISMSPYTERFILHSNNIKEGLSANSMSEIIAIQGEFGYIGLIVMLVLLILLVKKCKSFFSMMIVCFFIGLFLVDNVIEYAKYGVFFWLCFSMCNYNKCIFLDFFKKHNQEKPYEWVKK